MFKSAYVVMALYCGSAEVPRECVGDEIKNQIVMNVLIEKDNKREILKLERNGEPAIMFTDAELDLLFKATGYFK